MKGRASHELCCQAGSRNCRIRRRHRSEAALVASFRVRVRSRETCWGALELVTEFDYQAGRTDIVARTAAGEIVAIEAKIDRWRDALHQAWRNLCFAHRSYVLLSPWAAARAAAADAEFARRGVGVCILTCNGIVELLPSPRGEPWLPYLTHAVSRKLDLGKTKNGRSARAGRLANLRQA